MNVNDIKRKMARDTLLYLPAKIIEGAVGMITISLYTSFFKPEVYGDYTLITTGMNIANILMMGWLIQSVFRFVNSFNSPKKLKVFYATAFTPWLFINAFVLAIGAVSSIIAAGISGSKTVELIAFTSLMFFTYSTTQILFSMLAAVRRIKLNLVLSIFSVSAKLGITTLFVSFNLFGRDVVTAILSNVLVDLFVITVISSRLKLLSFLTFKMFSKKIFYKFLKYSLPLIGVNITMGILNVSDRFVIKPILGSAEVGIYSANYQIASAVFSMIQLAIMRGVYPMIIKTWKQNERSHTEDLMGQAVRYYLLVSLPAVVGLSILSGPVARILSPKYYEGRYIIILVSVGLFFWGLTDYSNKAWELTSNTKPVLRNSLMCAIFNISFNIAFVPVFGYFAAGVSTALCYMLYLAISLKGSSKILKWKISAISCSRITASSLLMGLVLYFCTRYVSHSLISLIWMIPSGALVYAVCLALSRELGAEIQQIKHLLKFKSAA